jgi:arginyl-tRNA synthetase
MFQVEQQAIAEKIKTFCVAHGIPLAALEWKPIPFEGEWGFSTSFFATAALEARTGRKGFVPLRAQEIAGQVKEAVQDVPGISHVEAVKGYLNLFFETAEYARRVVDTILEQKNRFGSGPATGQRVMIEFSQPNTHKAFHVGHLRSAILGDALARIIEFAGYKVVRANYPGDMGLHVIKWLWAYLKYHAGEQPGADITEWMGRVYAQASRRLEENPELESEVRAVYARWDKRDPEIVALWQKTRQWSLVGFQQMYAALDIRFDKYYFNSEEEQAGKQIVEELVKRDIATDERPRGGAVVVKIDELLGLKKEQYRTTVILRSDGTALYSTEDLALVLHKFRDYPDLSRSVYVVDVRQSLHFTQVFKIMEIAGYEQAKKCVHVAYELVTLPGNVVVSSREGTVVLLEDLLREAVARAREEASWRNPSLSGEQLDAVAKAVGLGALKYPIVARENTKLVTFDWKAALDFNGQAAPYIQYAHVRCNSIIKKSKAESSKSESRSFEDAQERPADSTYDLHAAEIQLIDLISRFPAEVQRAAAEYKPLIIANSAYDIAKAFAGFYDTCPVVHAEPQVREARLRLVAATKYTLANALALLGITAPEVM